MISFDEFTLPEDMSNELKKLKIDIVFQPIFYPDGKTIYAYESLMRPVEKSVEELIDEYMDLGKLHVLEIASFFGAAKVYLERGYEERICINSFPSEVFSKEETKVFDKWYRKYSNRGIVKILEYPDISLKNWEKKNKTLRIKGLDVSLNNFGEGNNDFEALTIFKPKIVKIGRELVANIHKDNTRQDSFLRCIKKFHDLGAHVIVGGIECKEEFDFVVPNGADFIQGFYLGEPK